MKYKIKPYKLKNTIQRYDWGNRNDAAYIPQLLGLEPEKDKPYAELWMGVHPKAPSKVQIENSIIPLSEYISSNPIGILGRGPAAIYDNKLPFLLKVLSVGETLSIQAHPNKKQAERLHDVDPENYPDDNYKPEIAIAIDDFWALTGFRTVEELKKIFDAYPEIANFIGTDLVESFKNERNKEQGFESLKMLYKLMVSRAIDKDDALESSLSALTKRLVDRHSKNKEETLFIELRAKYGTDVGLFNLFFLNLIHLTAGQAIFLPAGAPHAYLQGNIIECMANSDNVVRAGLTPKFKDAKTLLKIITFNRKHLPVIQPSKNEKVFHYPTPVKEFEILRILLEKGDNYQSLTDDSLRLALVLEGVIEVRESESDSIENERFYKGESFIIPDSMNRFTVFALEKSVFFIVNIGR